MLGRPLVGCRLRAQPPHLGQGPLQGADDIGQGDLGRRPSQVVARLAPRWLATIPARRKSLKITPRNFAGSPWSLGERCRPSWARGPWPSPGAPRSVIDLRGDVHTRSVGPGPRPGAARLSPPARSRTRGVRGSCGACRTWSAGPASTSSPTRSSPISSTATWSETRAAWNMLWVTSTIVTWRARSGDELLHLGRGDRVERRAGLVHQQHLGPRRPGPGRCTAAAAGRPRGDSAELVQTVLDQVP